MSTTIVMKIIKNKFLSVVYINDMKGGVRLHNWSISLCKHNSASKISASKIRTQKIIYYCA